MDLVAVLPWWAGLSLAVVSYLLLHRVAGQQVMAVTQPGQLGTMVTQTMWKTLATFGQYIVPLICLAGAGVSAWRRHERQALLASATQGKAADVLDGMSWREFELLVGEAFRRRGYRVVETGRSGPDGGVDLVLTKDNEKYLVQCKQWKAFRVGVDVVRELYGVMAAKGAAGGFVVTSGRFTDEASRFAAGRNVELIDGHKLHDWIANLQQRPARVQGMDADGDRPDRQRAEMACPLCSKPMVTRTARQGAKKGSQFWGCTGYPSCRGTLPIA